MMPSKRLLNAVSLCAASVAILSGSLAAEDPPALCTEDILQTLSGSPTAPDSLPLPCTDAGRLPACEGPFNSHQRVSFSDNTGTYRADVLSAWTLHPTRRGYLCIRYELENITADQKTIPRLGWPDIFDVKNTQFGDPKKHAEEIPIIVLTQTLVKALDDKIANPSVWALFSPNTKSPVVSPGPSLVPRSLWDAIPGILGISYLDRAELGTAYGLGIPARQTAFDEFNTYHGTGSFSIQSISYASYFEGEFTVTSKIQHTELPGSAAILAPYLKAYETLEDPTDLSKEFAAARADQSAISTVDGSYFVEYGFSLADMDRLRKEMQGVLGVEDVPALFIVKHPIKIVTEDATHCFMTYAYSPVPLSLTLAACGLDE